MRQNRIGWVVWMLLLCVEFANICAQEMANDIDEKFSIWDIESKYS